MKTLVTGATGLVGRALLEHIETPVVLSRDPERARRSLGGVEAHAWEPERKVYPPDEALAGISAVVHLAGEPIAGGRWTDERKKRIERSRGVGTELLVERLRHAGARPQVFVSASAVGYYGDRGDEELSETAKPGDGWLSDVCVGWERAAASASILGARVVSCRLGLVLSSEGGALEKMLPPFRMGVGGRLGSGKQWMPWVHIDDAARCFALALKEPSLSGPVNVVSPNPVRNTDFTGALGEALGRPTLLPVPRLALRAVLGEMATILMASQRALPSALQTVGYDFAYPALPLALSAVLASA